MRARRAHIRSRQRLRADRVVGAYSVDDARRGSIYAPSRPSASEHVKAHGQPGFSRTKKPSGGPDGFGVLHIQVRVAAIAQGRPIVYFRLRAIPDVAKVRRLIATHLQSSVDRAASAVRHRRRVRQNTSFDWWMRNASANSYRQRYSFAELPCRTLLCSAPRFSPARYGGIKRGDAAHGFAGCADKTPGCAFSYRLAHGWFTIGVDSARLSYRWGRARRDAQADRS